MAKKSDHNETVMANICMLQCYSPGGAPTNVVDMAAGVRMCAMCSSCVYIQSLAAICRFVKCRYV